MRIFKFFLVLMTNLLACSNRLAHEPHVETNIWPGYEPLYLARHDKYLQDDKVHLIKYSSAAQVIQAYRNKLIDAAALTLDEVLLFAASILRK